MLKRFSSSFALLALISAPANAQLREAPLVEIFESYNDCFAATDTGSLETSKLEELGWARATMSTENGEDIASELILFGHGSRAPLIMLTATEGKGACVVTARIASFETFTEFTVAFGGQLPDPDEAGAISYRANGRSVQIAPTGSRDKPSMRLLVATPSESN